MKKLIPILVLLAGCATSPSKREFQAPLAANEKINFILTTARENELDPCGCDSRPLGGIVREYNAIEKWKATHPGNYILVSQGPTFVELDDLEKAYRKVRSNLLAEGLRTLGVEVVGMDPVDFRAGEDLVAEAHKKSGAYFVATNMEVKPSPSYLKTSAELSYGTNTFLFLSVVDPKGKKIFPVPKGISISDPEAAIRKALASLPKKERFVVLLSSLSPEANLHLKKKFPEIRLIVGSSADRTTTVEEPEGTLLTINPLDRGRVIGRLTIDAFAAMKPFYNKNQAESTGAFNRVNNLQIKQTLEKLKGKLSKKERAALQAKLKELQEFSKESDPVPLTPEGNISYDWELVELDAQFSNPENKLTPLVDKYHKETHDLSVKKDAAD